MIIPSSFLFFEQIFFEYRFLGAGAKAELIEKLGWAVSPALLLSGHLPPRGPQSVAIVEVSAEDWICLSQEDIAGSLCCPSMFSRRNIMALKDGASLKNAGSFLSSASLENLKLL